jgi:Uri superfamily endonuclease
MRGVYILCLYIDRDTEIDVGRLGRVFFREGYYAYVGSGGRNLLRRVCRHFGRDKRIRWHIDYLTRIFLPEVALLILDDGVKEGNVVEILSDLYSFVDGFGASDSPHKSHLFYLGDKDGILSLRRYLSSSGYRVVEYHP